MDLVPCMSDVDPAAPLRNPWRSSGLPMVTSRTMIVVRSGDAISERLATAHARRQARGPALDGGLYALAEDRGSVEVRAVRTMVVVRQTA